MIYATPSEKILDIIPFLRRNALRETGGAFTTEFEAFPLKSYALAEYSEYQVKIYFGFTVAGDRSGIDTARKVVQLLEDLGHSVLTRHLVDDNAWEADRAISAQDVYRRDMAWLAECELFIAEVSGSSFGLGFETGFLLGATTKRVILLFRRAVEGRVSLLISGNTHENCTLVPYATFEEVENVIIDNVGSAKSVVNT